MPNYLKKISLFFLVVFILTAVFFSGITEKKGNYAAHASFWNTIKAWVTINPLDVDVSAPVEVEVNKVFKVDANIINKGREKIKNVKGEIHLPAGLTLLKKNPVQNAGVLSGSKEKKISFRVKGNEIGNYFIVVSVSGELKKELISAEDSTTVEVKKEKTSTEQKHSSGFFKRFLGFFRKWFND